MTERQKTLAWKKTQAQRDRFSRTMTREWKHALMEQIKPVIAEISESSVYDIEHRIPKLITEELVEEQLDRTIEVVGVYFAKTTFKDIRKAYEPLTITKMGGLPSDQEWAGFVKYTLGKRAGERITAITDSSRDQAIKVVKRTLGQAAQEGMGTSQMSQLLRDNLNSEWGEISTYRAARIARTEVTMASNLGSLTGAERSGEPMFKVWLSTRDRRTRRRRRKQVFDHYGTFPTGPDGEKRDLDEKFTLTGEHLMHPGAYGGSAANVIHCRCTMYYEPKTIDAPPVAGEITRPTGPKPAPPPRPSRPAPAGTDPWKSKPTATAELKKILGAEDIDVENVGLDVMKAYGEAVNKLKAAGWPVQVQQFGRFGRYSHRRSQAHAWAHQSNPLYNRKSMIEYKSSGFTSGKKVKALNLEEQRVGWSPIIDEGNELQYVFVHETGHTMVQFRQAEITRRLGSNGAQVIRQADEIFDRYKAKIRQTQKQIVDETSKRWLAVKDSTAPGDVNRVVSEIRGEVTKEIRGDWFICDYATHNLEEFWAESFSQVALSSKPSPFAQEIVALVKQNLTP